MKRVIIVSLILFSISFVVGAQENYPRIIQMKVIEGLRFVYCQQMKSPADMLLVKLHHKSGFCRVINLDDSLVEAKEVFPPDYMDMSEVSVEIAIDSVADIVWIKKKEFQTLKLKNSENPFKKLKSRFQNDTMESLQMQISQLFKNMSLLDYQNRMQAKYPGLLMVKKYGKGFPTILMESKSLFPFIVYPEEARMNGTQGAVALAFVITKNGDLDDEIHVIDYLGDGCTEAIIVGLKEMARQVKINNMTFENDIYYDGSYYFQLD
ncbi:MAG: energy transducer TonB [Bacteroidales bacterium]|nr:energy transducer TonB [Bacteroidales bacterium]